MAILLEQNAEQTLNVKGSKLDLASYCEIEQVNFFSVSFSSFLLSICFYEDLLNLESLHGPLADR